MGYGDDDGGPWQHSRGPNDSSNARSCTRPFHADSIRLTPSLESQVSSLDDTFGIIPCAYFKCPALSQSTTSRRSVGSGEARRKLPRNQSTRAKT